MKISITPSAGRSAVVGLSCGTSTPRLSGSVDISNFFNLTSFRCVGNDIQFFTGNNSTPNLKLLNLSDNKLSITPNFSQNLSLSTIDLNTNRLSGDFPNSISALPNLQDFRIFNNYLSGSLPPLTANTNLVTFYAYGLSNTVRQLSGSLNIEGLTKLSDIRIGNSSLTGTLPSLSTNSALTQFQMGNSKFNGPLPSLSCSSLRGYQIFNNPINGYIFSNLDNVPNLDLFWVSNCGLSGDIPRLDNLSKLTRFLVTTNSLTGTVPPLSGCLALWSFQANVNKLTDFTLSPIPTGMASRVVSVGDTTPKGLVFTSNNFNLTASWYCLSAMLSMYQTATATGAPLNTLTGVQIALGGANMPSINGVGTINTEIKTIIQTLSTSPYPGWTITMGSSTING